VTACEDNPEERFARREMRKLMADAIQQLAPDMRQVCLLRDVLQYSTQEVAERLGFRRCGAAQALPSAPATPGKAERGACSHEAEASARGGDGADCAAATRSANANREFHSRRLPSAPAEIE